MRGLIRALGEWLVRVGTPPMRHYDPADVEDLMRIVERASRWADRDAARVPGERARGVLHGGPLDGSPTGYVPETTTDLILPDYRTAGQAIYVRGEDGAFVYSRTEGASYGHR